MVLLYIIEFPEEGAALGVIKKVHGQVEAFNLAGLKCSLHTMPYSNPKRGWIRKKINRRLPFTNRHEHWDMNPLLAHDCIYIRRLGTLTPYMNKFFRELKEKNSSCKIVWELPTYPYDMEYKNRLKDRSFLLTDCYSRKSMYKWVDRIATLTDDKTIFGVPTLKIRNGIDLSTTREKQISLINDIHAIAVAGFSWWHGYERFLKGLREYYQNYGQRNVVFHMVGDGPELKLYHKLVEDYNLANHVIFHGEQHGDALDDIYDQCNLGIASLGFYRSNLTEGQPLKTREYLAKGLPFIFSAKVSDIPPTDAERLYLQVPNNDSPIDIAAVIKFYDRIYAEGAEAVNHRLRKYAEENFSMEAVMREVIEYFKVGKVDDNR